MKFWKVYDIITALFTCERIHIHAFIHFPLFYITVVIYFV